MLTTHYDCKSNNYRTDNQDKNSNSGDEDVPPFYAINSLSLNIMEAVIQDKRLGNLNKAETGKILAKYVHTPEKDNRTGSGPCLYWLLRLQ